MGIEAMEPNKVFHLLEAFFSLFKAHILSVRLVNEKVVGSVGWIGEGEKQDFGWEIKLKESSFSRVILLCNFIAENRLLDGDKITISENDIIHKLVSAGWTEYEANTAIDELCRIEVKMLDEGRETDSFFIHF